MYNMLVHAHSGLRWLVLIFLLLAIVTAWSNWSKKGDYPAGKMPLLGLIFTHLQLLIGFALYFMDGLGGQAKVRFGDMADTMGNTVLRFYTVEHITMMLIAIVLITMGYSKAKRQTEQARGHKTIFTFYLIGLILILAGIPWPFRIPGAGWF